MEQILKFDFKLKIEVTQKFGSSTTKIVVDGGQPKNRGDHQTRRSDLVHMPELAERNDLAVSGELSDQIEAELLVRQTERFGDEQLCGRGR